MQPYDQILPHRTQLLTATQQSESQVYTRRTYTDRVQLFTASKRPESIVISGRGKVTMYMRVTRFAGLRIHFFFSLIAVDRVLILLYTVVVFHWIVVYE